MMPQSQLLHVVVEQVQGQVLRIAQHNKNLHPRIFTSSTIFTPLSPVGKATSHRTAQLVFCRHRSQLAVVPVAVATILTGMLSFAGVFPVVRRHF